MGKKTVLLLSEPANRTEHLRALALTEVEKQLLA